jgi:hypothetical protein
VKSTERQNRVLCADGYRLGTVSYVTAECRWCHSNSASKTKDIALWLRTLCSYKTVFAASTTSPPRYHQLKSPLTDLGRLLDSNATVLGTKLFQQMVAKILLPAKSLEERIEVNRRFLTSDKEETNAQRTLSDNLAKGVDLLSDDKMRVEYDARRDAISLHNTASEPSDRWIPRDDVLADSKPNSTSHWAYPFIQVWATNEHRNVFPEPSKCTFFLTYEGHAGFGPPGLQSGDVLCKFPNTSIGIFLRVEDNHFVLVGGCTIAVHKSEAKSYWWDFELKIMEPYNVPTGTSVETFHIW